MMKHLTMKKPFIMYALADSGFKISLTFNHRCTEIERTGKETSFGSTHLSA